MSRSNRSYNEACYVMGGFLGRNLIRGEFILHKNGRKTDNRIGNLVLLYRSKCILIRMRLEVDMDGLLWKLVRVGGANRPKIGESGWTIMSRFLGRSLLKIESVCHKNGNPEDGEIENLILFSKSRRGRYIMIRPEVVDENTIEDDILKEPYEKMRDFGEGERAPFIAVVSKRATSKVNLETPWNKLTKSYNKRVLVALLRIGRPATPTEISKMIGAGYKTTYTCLNNMRMPNSNGGGIFTCRESALWTHSPAGLEEAKKIAVEIDRQSTPPSTVEVPPSGHSSTLTIPSTSTRQTSAFRTT